MTTFFQNPKMGADSATVESSYRTSWSQQLKRLAQGADLFPNQDVRTSAFLKNVTQLPYLHAKEKVGFLRELAAMVMDSTMPLLENEAALNTLLEIYRAPKSMPQAEIAPLFRAVCLQLEQPIGGSFHWMLRQTCKEIGMFPQSVEEWEGLVTILNAHPFPYRRIRFFLKNHTRFEIGIALEVSCRLSKQHITTLSALLKNQKQLKGRILMAAVAYIKKIKVAKKHAYRFGQLLGEFLWNAFPFLENKLKFAFDSADDFYQIGHGAQLYWFAFWLAYAKPFHFEDFDLKFSGGIGYFNQNYHLDSSIVRRLKGLPFYKIVKHISPFMWMRLGGNIIRQSHSDTLELAVHLALGQSIRTFNRIGPVSKRMAHIFNTLKVDEYEGDALYFYCFVKSMGGSRGLFELLYTFFRLTHRPADDALFVQRFTPFLQKLIAWKVEQNLSHNEQVLLMGYIAHLMQDEPDFSIKGRTLASMLRLARDNQRNYQSNITPEMFLTWKGADWQEWNLFHRGRWFAIFQLLSGKELARESAEMSHCVRTYTRRCHRGSCYIWSLRVKKKDGSWKRLVTIEVDSHKKIVQAKAKYNAHPGKEYLEMIKDWAEREELRFVRC